MLPKRKDASSHAHLTSIEGKEKEWASEEAKQCGHNRCWGHPRVSGTVLKWLSSFCALSCIDIPWDTMALLFPSMPCWGLLYLSSGMIKIVCPWAISTWAIGKEGTVLITQVNYSCRDGLGDSSAKTKPTLILYGAGIQVVLLAHFNGGGWKKRWVNTNHLAIKM